MAEAKRLGSSRDMAGRKREYETIYILRPDITNEVIGQVNVKIRGVVEAGGGTLLKVENWGKRKLAYEIKKETKGIYLYYRYLGDTSLVAEIERTLRLADAQMRYLSVKLADDVVAEERAIDESAQVDFLAKAEEAARAIAEAAARGETLTSDVEAVEEVVVEEVVVPAPGFEGEEDAEVPEDFPEEDA